MTATTNQGCGKQVHVIGTNGGKMPCGATLQNLKGESSVYLCEACLVPPPVEILQSEGLYFYKDTYMTGLFGCASRGSFVISTHEIDRDEFRLLLGSNHFSDVPVKDGHGRAFTLWIDPTTKKGSPRFSFKLEWIGGKRRLKLADGELDKAAEGCTAEEFEALRRRLESFRAF